MARRDARSLDHKTLAEMRIRAVEAVSRGEHPETVASVVGVCRSTVFAWLARARSGGEQALAAKPIPGRPVKIAAQQFEHIYRTIAGRTPLQYRFEFALWTLDRVRWLIAEDYGVRLSRTSTWRLMNRMGLSAQRPLRRAQQQDAGRVEQWRREEFPKIQAQAKAEKAQIWFGDEASVRSDYHSGTTGAPRGATPVVRTTGARSRWNMLSAVNGRGDMRFMLEQKSVTTATFVEFLRRLIQNAPEKVFLIVDGHPTHRAAAVGRFLQAHQERLRLFYLPSYSPELNPDELVWREVKTHGTGRLSIAGADQMKSLLLAALRRLQRMPEKIAGFIRTPQTAYTMA